MTCFLFIVRYDMLTGTNSFLPKQKNEMSQNQNEKKYATRQKILTAAYNLFTEKGYDNTSYTSIARHANVGYGTIYLYFKTKEDLLVALSIYNLETRLKQVDGATKNIKNPLERSFHFVNNMWSFDSKIPRRSLETFYGHRWRLGQSDYESLTVVMAQFANLIGRHIAEAQSLGLVKKNVDIRVAVHILSSCYYRALQDGRFNDEARKKAKETLDKQTRYILRLDED